VRVRAALDATPTATLRRIAASHGLAVDEATTRLELVDRLAERLADPSYLAELITSLADDERHALFAARDSGGEMRGLLIDRDQPGAAPALAERGLLFRTFAAAGPRRGEIFTVPDEVLQVLPPPRATESPPAHESPPNERRTSDPVFSLFALASSLARPGSDLAAEVRGWSAEPGGFEWAARWTFLEHLGRSTGLLDEHGPARGLRRALNDPVALTERLRRTYLHDRAWSELAGIGIEHAEALAEPTLVRAAFLEAVDRLPEGQWIAVDAFSEWLEQTAPDFLREQLDARGLVLLEPLPWARLEGELLRLMLLGPLYWLGIVATSADGRLIARRGPPRTTGPEPCFWPAAVADERQAAESGEPNAPVAADPHTHRLPEPDLGVTRFAHGYPRLEPHVGTAHQAPGDRVPADSRFGVREPKPGAAPEDSSPEPHSTAASDVEPFARRPALAQAHRYADERPEPATDDDDDEPRTAQISDRPGHAADPHALELPDPRRGAHLVLRPARATERVVPAPVEQPPPTRFELHAPARAELGTLLEVERYLVLDERGRTSRYRLVQQHLATALGAGGSVDDCRRLLTRLSRGALPEHVEDRLAAWRARYGAVSVRPAVVLDARTESELDSALAEDTVQPFIQRRLGPTTAEVAAADALALATALRASGHLPRIDAALRLVSEPRRSYMGLVDEQVLEFLLVSLLAFQHVRPERLAELEGALSLLQRLERQFAPERLAELRIAAERLAGELRASPPRPKPRRRRASPPAATARPRPRSG
jgi:hypothetical protein